MQVSYNGFTGELVNLERIPYRLMALFCLVRLAKSGFYTILYRPEVAKLRGSSGGDPREKSEAAKENYDTRVFKEPGH